MLIIGYQ